MDEGNSIDAVPDHSPDELNVLPCHRLLPQPGGFEGFVATFTPVNLDQLAVLHPECDCNVRIDTYPAAGASDQPPIREHDPIVAVRDDVDVGVALPVELDCEALELGDQGIAT